MATKEPIRVAISGAAGQICYSLIFLVARGEAFGKDQPVILQLLDIPYCEAIMGGVVMEISDCAFPLVQEVIATTDANVAFKDADYAILVGAFPRKQGMLRKDLLAKNVPIFKGQGKALSENAKKSVRVLVVGNPANTNALIAATCATDLPKSQFTALTMLDHNRARNQIAEKAGASVNTVKNVAIWGNHSKTQYPDASNALVGDKKATDVCPKEWLQSEFISTVQQRGAAIIAARKLSSAASAAKAIVDHVGFWHNGTAPGETVSMGVYSDGSYDIAKGLIFSFPVTIKAGVISIVQGLTISDFAREKLKATEKELLEEKETSFELLGLK